MNALRRRFHLLDYIPCFRSEAATGMRWASRAGSRLRVDRTQVKCESRKVRDWESERLTDAELHALFDRLFPQGFSGADVIAELAPDGWERSPLLACFHPSAERVLKERLRFHRNLQELGTARRLRDPVAEPAEGLSPEPTLEEVRRAYQPSPVRTHEELTELLGLCLWDVLSDNHEVISGVRVGGAVRARAILTRLSRHGVGSPLPNRCDRALAATRRAHKTVFSLVLAATLARKSAAKSCWRSAGL